MKQCPSCRKIYDDSWEICLDCSDILNKVAIIKGYSKRYPNMYGQDEDRKFKVIFKQMDDGVSKVSWNWYAAVFQVCWYAVKKMWPKAFLYGIILWAAKSYLVKTGMLFFMPILWAVSFLYFGVRANYDLYLYKRKKEHFWPRLSYERVKTAFWISIIMLIAINIMYAEYIKRKAVKSFSLMDSRPTAAFVDTDGSTFNNIPYGWRLYNDPPPGFSVTLIKSAGEKFNENLRYTAFPGTRFIGYSTGIDENGEDINKGIVAFIKYKPFFGGEFGSLEDKRIIEKAEDYLGVSEKPFYLDWIGRSADGAMRDISYIDVSGRQWCSVSHSAEIRSGEIVSVIKGSVYWTVSRGSGLFVVIQSYDEYYDDIADEAMEFMSSVSTG